MRLPHTGDKLPIMLSSGVAGVTAATSGVEMLPRRADGALCDASARVVTASTCGDHTWQLCNARLQSSYQSVL